jgi:hypothetical protein
MLFTLLFFKMIDGSYSSYYVQEPGHPPFRQLAPQNVPQPQKP